MIVCHFLGDFVFQTRYMAENKTKSVIVLINHVLAYACLMIPLAYLVSIEWFAFNVFMHFLQDLTWYKFCYKFVPKWEGNNTVNSKIWCVIGVDQMLHLLTLVGSYAAFPVG